MFRVEKAKNGEENLIFNKKYVHSRYNPSKEARSFAIQYDGMEIKTMIVVGLGLGYHIMELSRYIDNIKVYEISKEVVDICKKYNKDIFRKKNIEIIYEGNVIKKLAEDMKRLEDIIVIKGCLIYIETLNYNLYNKLKWYLINKESILKNSELLNMNREKNLLLEYEIIDNLINNFKSDIKKWIVLAAGPSLDDEIINIDKYKEKFNIICVGSAFRKVIMENINPDIVVIIDGKNEMYKQFEGVEDSDVPICFLETASNRALRKYKGNKYMFFNDKNIKSKYLIRTGKTVAVAALSICLAIGAKEVIFIGQDLASIDGKTHIKLYEEFYNIKNDDNINKSEKIKSVKGKEIYTEKGYVYFKEMIEEIVAENKEVLFINASKGAYIEGCEHIDFKKYVKERV